MLLQIEPGSGSEYGRDYGGWLAEQGVHIETNLAGRQVSGSSQVESSPAKPSQEQGMHVESDSGGPYPTAAAAAAHDNPVPSSPVQPSPARPHPPPTAQPAPHPTTAVDVADSTTALVAAGTLALVRFLPGQRLAMVHVEILSTKPSGLKWRSAGESRPTTGAELTNGKLAAALKATTDFSQQAWDAFGIQHLSMWHYVKVGDHYFRPAATAKGRLSSSLDRLGTVEFKVTVRS